MTRITSRVSRTSLGVGRSPARARVVALTILAVLAGLALITTTSAAGARGGSSGHGAAKTTSAGRRVAVGSPVAGFRSANAGVTDAALWIAGKVGGGLFDYAKSKALTEVLKHLGLADPTTRDLENHLVAIENQLSDLKADLDRGLQQLTEAQKATHYDLLVGKVDTLKGIVATTENTLLDVLKFAADPGKKEYVEAQLAKYVYPNIKDLRTTWEGNPVVRNFILGSSSGTSSAYKVLSDVVTGSPAKIFTWRESAYMNGLFRSALDLQAIQFNLIVQVRTAEGVPASTIYEQDAESYLGSEANLRRFLNDPHASMPASGWLHDELSVQRTQLPAGTMIDTRTGLMWSTDVPGGSRLQTLVVGGKGVPVCTGVGDQSSACVTDPHYSLGPTQPAWVPPRWPGSPADHLAKSIATGSLGGAQEWSIPTPDQLKSLFATYRPSVDGPAQAWLEARSGGDPGCEPQRIMGEAASHPASCLWPNGSLWSADSKQLIGDVRQYNCTSDGSCYPPGGKVMRRIPYGWHFDMFDLASATTSGCDLVAPTVDWSQFKDGGSYTYTGPSVHPAGSHSCAGGLVLTRKLKPDEQGRYYF